MPSSAGLIHARTHRRFALGPADDSGSHPRTIRAPTQVGGGTRRRALPSAHEPARGPREDVLGGRPARAPADRRGARARRRTQFAERPADGPLALRASARRPRCADLRPQAVPVRRAAAYWVLAAAITFYDGELIAFIGSLGVVGLATAFMLGNLRNGLKAGIGLAVVTVGIVTVVYNIPGTTTTSNFVFITLRFVVAWLAGYAMRERAEQAEAAEERAIRAEHEREQAARVAVAEERARIARELHDIVAHAVSVMVLQVGAVSHRLPDSLAEDREALRSVERAGRTALTEMRRLLSAMRREGRKRSSCRSPASTASTRSWTTSAAPGCPRTARRRPALRTSPWDRPLRVSDRSGGPDQRAQACARQRRRRDRALSAGRAGDRGPRQRSGQRDERRPGARARGRPRARQDLRR